MVKFVTHFSIHKFVDYAALIILFGFCQQISHSFNNQEQTKYDLEFQSLILCGFFSIMVILNTIILMYFNYCQAIVPYCTIKYNISFFLNINKSFEQTEKDKKVFYRFFICGCPGLSNRCTFGLVNWLSGRFAPATELELSIFRPSPFWELVCHLSTQANNGLLAAYITFFDLRRGKRRCFIPFTIYALVYPSISSNLVTLANLSPWSYSVCTHNCSPFSRKPLLRWPRTFETGLLINW